MRGRARTRGRPLATTKKALLSAVSTSFNTGYKLDVNRPYNMERNAPPGPLSEFIGAVESPGWTAPTVQVARVGYTLQAPALNGMRYTLRDFHLKPLGNGTVRNSTFALRADLPVWIVEFER